MEGQIVDKAKELYPDLEGSILLQYLHPTIPTGYQIFYSNVSLSADNDKHEWLPTVFPEQESWTWNGPSGFSGMYPTPELCLEALKRHVYGDNK